ncbi:MAG: efflux RND transporter periplasmic adaptor subunit [Gammaproteobacteria bacterium]|nr:efflux RND transporter periplasmic adaptor subunit [Gammaproteobacteria bacterium]
MRKLLVATLCVALSALVSCAADDKTNKADAKSTIATKPALSVSLTTPQTEEWTQTLAATGNVTAWQEALIGAEIGGLRLTQVLVNVGDHVHRGQVLANLQSDTVAAEVAQTRASVAEAQALLAEAKANAERARQLQASGAISAQQAEQNFTGEQTALARIDALRAKLSADELRLAQTRVLASDDGAISARNATVGAVVQPGQELFRLIRQQRLEWRGEVSADQLARIRPGVAAQVTPAGGDTVIGNVRMVAPTVDPQTRNGIVYVDLPNPGPAKAGMFARGQFELGKAQALTLPQSAVLLREGFAYVFRIDAASKAIQTKVGTGRRVGDRIEITSGLDHTAKVVASGAGFLSDGDVVRVIDGGK